VIAEAAEVVRYRSCAEVARLLRVPEHVVARLYRRKLLRETAWHAGARLLGPDDVEAVRVLLVEQGIIGAPECHAEGAPQ
jgi:hypothetical protein